MKIPIENTSTIQESTGIIALRCLLESPIIDHLALKQQIKDIFEPESEDEPQTLILLNELDFYLNELLLLEGVFFSEDKLIRVLSILKEAIHYEKVLRSFNSIELLLKGLLKADQAESLCLLLEVLLKVVSCENKDFKANKNELVRLSHIGKALFMHLNSHNSQCKAKLTDFFKKDPNFNKLMSNLKEYEQETYNIEKNIFIFEFTLPNKEALDYEELVAGQYHNGFPTGDQDLIVFKRSLTLFDTKPCEEILNELIKNKEINIKTNSPLYDAFLFRLKLEKILKCPKKENNSLILALILRSACLNIIFHKIITAFPEDNTLFALSLSSNQDLFIFMKNLLNLFFLKLTPDSHLLVLNTLQTLLTKGYYKQPRAFMASIFSYKELFQKILKDCANLKWERDGSVRSPGNVLDSDTASDSRFIEELLSLIKSRMKLFFTNEDSHINIYALSSLIASFANILSCPVDQSGHMAFSFKTLKYVADIFKELLPHQESIRDFNLIEIVKGRLEHDLNFLASYNEKNLKIFEAKVWKPKEIRKLILFDAKLVRIIDSGFFPYENPNHHHGMTALARKIVDSAFLSLLETLLKRKQESSLQSLAFEAIILIGDLGQEAPNLIGKLLQGDLIPELIEWVFKPILPKSTLRILPGLMNFIYVICLNPKGVELEKKHDLFNLNFKLLFEKEFLEPISRDINENKNNIMVLLAIEVNKLIGNISNFREIAFKVVSNLLFSLLKKQEDFLQLVASHFEGIKLEEKPLNLKELFEYETLVNSLNNFSEFLCKFMNVRFLDKCGKNLALPFVRLVSFPMLSLMEFESHSKIIKCLHHFAFNSKETRFQSHGLLLDELTKELALLEKRLGNFDSLEDLNSIIQDDLAFVARTKGLKPLLEESHQQKKYLDSLSLLGSITFIENLLDFAMYAQLFKNKPGSAAQNFPKIVRLYRLIINQLNREDLFYLKSLFKEKNKPKTLKRAIEVLKTAHDPNRLHFHDNLKTFLVFSITNKDAKSSKITYLCHQETAQILSRMLLTLTRDYNKLSTEETILSLTSSLNILTHIYELTRDSLKYAPNQVLSAEFTIKLFEEGVYSNFFRYLESFLAFLGSLTSQNSITEPFFLSLLEEILTQTITLLTKFIKVFIFIPNDLDIEIFINGKLERNETLKPFINFILIEMLNGFAICLRSLQIPLQTPKPLITSINSPITSMNFLIKPLSNFLEVSLLKLRGLLSLKHQDSGSKSQPPVKPIKKKPFYGYGFEDNIDSPEWIQLAQDAIQELSMMGFTKEIAELAISNLEYPSIEAATEWILSHPEEVKKIEEDLQKDRKILEEANKKEKKSVNTGILQQNPVNLGNKQMNDFPEKEYNEELVLILWNLGKALIMRLNSLSGLEKSVWEFLAHLINIQKPELQKGLSLELYQLFSELLKRLMEIGKGGLKLGLKKLQPIEEKAFMVEGNINNETRLKDLDNLFGLLLKASILKENSELRKKLLREKNCIEMLRFLEKTIEIITSDIGLIEWQSFSLKILVFCNEVFSLLKEQFKAEYSKQALILLISLLQKHTAFLQSNLKPLWDKIAFEGVLSLLANLLENNQANIRVFIEKKGLIELLKMEELTKEIDGCLLGLLTRIFEIILIDQETLENHYEAQIKRFFYGKNLKIVPLNDFLQNFKEYNGNNVFSKVVKRLCNISKTGGNPIKKEENPNNNEEISKGDNNTGGTNKEKIKIQQNIITLLENIHLKNDPLANEKKALKEMKENKEKEQFFIKLTPNTCLTTFTTSLISSSEKTIPVPNKDSSFNELKTIDFSLKGTSLLTLHTLLEALLSQFINHLNNNNKKLLISYPFLIKALHLLIRKYPILIPGLLKYNCNKFLRKQMAENDPVYLRLQSFKKAEGLTLTRGVSFLKFFLRVVLFYSHEEFHHFLFEIALDNYLLIESKSKEILPFSSLVRQKILNNIYSSLKGQIDRPEGFLHSKESLKVVFCYSSLHVLLLRIAEFTRSSLKTEEGLFHNFLKLYCDAFKLLSIESFGNQESGFLLLQTPLALLYQFYIHGLKKDQAFNGQLIQGKVLTSDGTFFDDWKLVYSNEGLLPETLDINPLRLIGIKGVAHGHPFENGDYEENEENPLSNRIEHGNVYSSVELAGLNPNEEDEPIRELEEEEVPLEEEDPHPLEEMMESPQESDSDEIGDNMEELEEEEEEENQPNEGLEGDSGLIEEEENNDDESESIEEIEEEKLNENLNVNVKEQENRQFKGLLISDSMKQGHFVNIESVLTLEHSMLEAELTKGYNTMLNISPIKIDPFIQELKQMARVCYNPTGTFFTEWQGLYQKTVIKQNETLFSPLKKERGASTVELDPEDRVFLLERLMIQGEEDDNNYRSPLRLLNMLINEREDRFRNYFQDMRSHLDILRGFLNPSILPNERESRGLEREAIGLGDNLIRAPVQLAGINNEEMIGSFRNNMINEFQDRIESLEEESKQEELAQRIDIEDLSKNDQAGIIELIAKNVNNINNTDNNSPTNNDNNNNNLSEINQNTSGNQEFTVNINPPMELEQEIPISPIKNLSSNPLSPINQIEEEKEEQKQPLSNPQPEETQPNPPQNDQNFDSSPVNFEDLGLPANFLQLNQIDLSYFNSLSYDLKMDLILQYLPQDSQNSNPIPSNNQPPVEEQKEQQNVPPNPADLLDAETIAFLNELPENIRAEVLQQQLAPFIQNPNANPQPEIDNATFLASLLPDLREEVLLTASPEFLESLPPEIIAEAQALRDRVNFRNPASRYWQREPELMPRKKEKKEFKPVFSANTSLLKDKTLLQKLNNIDEKVIENILSFLYCDRRLFQKLPLGFLQTLLRSPQLEYKLFDALLFVLLFENLPIAAHINENRFPYLNLYESGGIVSNYEKVYSEVGLRALYLLSRFTQKSSCGYFLDYEEKKGLDCLAVYKNKLSFLGKQSNLNQLLSLTGFRIFQKSFIHLDLLVTVLFNITEKIRSGKNADLDLKIDPQCIGNLCHILSIDFIDDNMMRNLSAVISVLCLEKRNLDCFIEQLKVIIFKISEKMNFKLEENLLLLEKSLEGQESSIMNELEGHLEGERQIYKIFKIIKDLFEKALSIEKREKKEAKEGVKPINDPLLNINDPNAINKGVIKKEVSQEEETKKEEIIKKEEILPAEIKQKEVRDSFQTLIMNESLNNLWINVTELLMVLNEKYPNTVNFLNPIIHKLIKVLEGFFIIYSIMRDDSAINKQVDQMKKNMPKISQYEETEEYTIILEKTISNIRNSKISIDEMFALLCERNKKILNMLIRQNLALLTESMKVIVDRMPKILEFDIKKNYFRREMKKLKGDRGERYYHPIKLRIRRDKLFVDSYHQLKNLSAADIKRKITIEFIGEEGIDQGGLTREWFSLISREMFNENYALFVRSPNGITFQPDPRSKVNPDHLQYFKFAGRVIGKALYDGYMADAYFTRAFYKHILGKSLNIFDMEDIDPQYFKTMKWILENDVKDLEFTFSFERDNFGRIEVHDLIENGRNISVTNENKKEYVEKICYAKMAEDIKEQIQMFLAGFNELIPTNIISVFDSMELELMISGLPDIDILDLKENVEYKQYTKDSPVIKWLWEILETLDKSEKAGFIQFVTGTSKVPIEGFKALKGISGPTKLSINKTYDNAKLPTSHTCFNQLDLPEYPTKEILRDKLLLAIREGKEGFGFL